MNAVFFDDREDPGKKASAALAAAVHVALIVLLVYGVRWQVRSPEAVEVELVRAVPAPAPAAVAPPEPEPVPPPKVEPKPEPKVEPKPEPKPAPPAKPDIALKEKEKPKPKPEPKPVPKAEPKPVPDKASRQMLEKELKDLAAQREKLMAERELAQGKAAQAAASAAKARATWIQTIQNRVRNNVVLPLEIKGNPESIFEITQLPSGEIIDVKLKKSSGNAALDAAAERSIRKASPLPRQEPSDPFLRTFNLSYRPYEQ